MKILYFITRSCLGGAQSVIINIANSLCHKHNVAVAAGIDDGEDASMLWDALDPAVKCYRIRPLVKRLNIIKDMQAASEMRMVYNDFKPDVVHLHSSKVGVLGRLVLPSKKIIYTVHGFDSIRIANRKYLVVEKLLQNRCRFIVGVSQYDCDNLIKEGIKHNVILVHNGLNVMRNDNIVTPASFSKTKKNIICIARISPQKNHKLFIDIASLLPNYNFIWIGNLEAITNSQPDNCHFIGNLPNAGMYCRFADLFLLTSNYEGLPMVIIEAMSQGLPIVSSDVGGVYEIVKNGINGYVIPNDANEFVKKITSILEDEAVYHKMSLASNQIYNESLTVDKMVSKYFDLYGIVANTK